MTKYGNQGRGPISKKILSRIGQTSKKKVIDLSQFQEARLKAENLEKTVITEKALASLDPLHAIYSYAQNKMSVFAEQLGEFYELSKLRNAYATAYDEYLPSGPPMSPLTTSYFTCWGFFDLNAGIERETFGTVAIDVCRLLGVNKNLITVFEQMQNSRMGVYLHEGISGKCVLLREIMTDRKIRAISASGYLGSPGQIWYSRIMPEPFPEMKYGYDVVFTTPYVLGEIVGERFLYATEKNWVAFSERNILKTNISASIQAYELLMKYGLNKNYWNEFIFEAYVNHQRDMILLAGFPDIAVSRPHSRENQSMRGE